MQALSREIGLTVSLGTRDRLGITVLDEAGLLAWLATPADPA